MADWQPIETAPKDRWSRVLGWCVFPAGAEVRIVTLAGFCHATGAAQWRAHDITQSVTHWMALPPPPAS